MNVVLIDSSVAGYASKNSLGGIFWGFMKKRSIFYSVKWVSGGWLFSSHNYFCFWGKGGWFKKEEFLSSCQGQKNKMCPKLFPWPFIFHFTKTPVSLNFLSFEFFLFFINDVLIMVTCQSQWTERRSWRLRM